MELLTNPWFIVFNAVNIIGLIYLVIKYRCKYKHKPTLYKKLRNVGIHPTLRKPIKENDLKGGNTNNNPSNNT